MARKYVGDAGWEKEFLKLFNQLTYSRSSWQVWEGLMTAMACAICNAADRREEPLARREAQYERAIKELGGVDIPAQIFSVVVMALEENPNQDFLGKLYMNLNLGSHWHGQFFTPYNVSELMARMLMCGDKDPAAEIEQKGYISIADCCIGGGAMMIAATNIFREKGINYQNHVIFAGQDIDRVAAMMAYIQLSLLGCPGYIVVGDTLANPMIGHALFPQENEGQEVWYTPFFMTDVWEGRRLAYRMDRILERTIKSPKVADQYTFFFNFDEKEAVI